MHTVVLHIQEHMGKLVDLLDHSLREDISVEYNIADALWPIEVDVSQFDIAVLNLAVNAKDAMPRGGLLRVIAANHQGALDGIDAVEISVKDEGSGMMSEALEKAFEPFFTTKEVGKGTGLGLSQVFGFVRASGGTVSIDSEPGQGTTVTLLLPRCDAKEDTDAESHTPADSFRLRGLRVLLVEDDPHLNELVTQMLEELGAQVVRASSAAEGLEAFKRSTVEAVLTGMVMPGEMNGLEMAREIRQLSREIPVILMTGYSEAAESVSSEGFPLLRKPFTFPQLTKHLTRSLSRPPN